MNNARTQLTSVLALGAALAMPLAFAQSAVTPEVRDAQEAATEAAASAQADDAQASDAQDPQDAAAQPAPRQLGWADVDADGNGTISREESAALPALAAVFAEADADADGELTADEYRTHAAKAGGE
ncbi:EF-hand domain-containing protein [Luteimonas sp. MJ246]|uniref:EF-hand domain-containing protein n=1 Tax=Luteimonas sp. MJ174 TaxID=3129237 RepID=UPI0031BB7B0D